MKTQRFHLGLAYATLFFGWMTFQTLPLFAQSTVQITFDTDPMSYNVPHQTFQIDGVAYTTKPLVFNWTPGSVHTIQPGSTKYFHNLYYWEYRFVGWSDGVKDTTRQIVVPASNTTYKALYDKYGRFRLIQGGGSSGGTVTQSSSSPDNYYLAGTRITCQATPNPGFVFKHWLGLDRPHLPEGWYVYSTNNTVDVSVNFWLDLQAVFQVVAVGPVVYWSHFIDDVPGGTSDNGDGDGVAERGERVGLAVALLNQGTETAVNVAATLSGTDPDVTILDNGNYWEDILAGFAKENLGNFAFEVNPNLSQNKTVNFTVRVTANNGGPWTNTVAVPIFAQHTNAPGPVVYSSHTIDDDASGSSNGDGDGKPENGERIELRVRLANQANPAATSVRAILTSSDSDIAIFDNQCSWPDIAGGATADASDPFGFSVNSNLAQNKTVNFKITVMANNGGPWTSTLAVPIFTTLSITAPSNLAAVLQNHTTDRNYLSVKLTWQDNSDNEQNFRIERKVGAAGNWGEISQTSLSNYLDNNVSLNQTYFYRVRANSGSVFSNYSNEASVAVPPALFVSSAGLERVANGATAWGDYDNDGDLDVLLTGVKTFSVVSKIYRNNAGQFEDINASLAGFANGTAEWGDYDNDGDLDILIGTKIYRNDNGNFVELAAQLPAGNTATWGDYDNDGDLDILLTGTSASSPITRIYRNDHGSFVDIAAGLAGVSGGTAAWGDYDTDGDLDILLAGGTGANPIAKIYRNDEGMFVDVQAALQGVVSGNGAWGDYDMDGDLDILLTGSTGTNRTSKIYRNESGSFVDIGAVLQGITQGKVLWGDYDNDGDPDVFLTGVIETFETGVRGVTRIYRNDAGSFVDTFMPLLSAAVSSIACGDYDADKDLDLILTGDAGAPGFIGIVYRNTITAVNTAPQAPADLATQVSGNTATLSWRKSTDAQTPANGLTYNLRLGKTPGGSEIMAPMTDATTGFRRIAQLGNTNHRNSWTIKNLAPGTYYWSVQAIDNAFIGSAFAPEQTFSIPPQTTGEIKAEAAASQLIGAEFEVAVSVNAVQNLFGVSFELNYTNTAFVDVVTPTTSNVLPGPFLGSDVIFIANVDETAGKVSIGISRKSGQSGISGSGTVARIKFKSLSSTPNGTSVIFALGNVSANDPAGTSISLTALSDTTKIIGLIVWPGDTNNDKIVNQADVLPLGLHWNRTGPRRDNATTAWVGQVATPWTPEAATYADANGDGVVNQADVLPIGLNFGRTHSAPNATAGRGNDSPLLHKTTAATIRANITGNTNPGQDFDVEILVDQVTNLFGVSFELLYAPTVLADPQSSEAGSFMGNEVIFFSNIDKSAGKLSIGVTRKAPQSGVNGAGMVARIKMRVSSQAVRGQAITLTLQNVTANDPNGQAIQLNVTASPPLVVGVLSRQNEALPTAFALHANAPNPFNPSTEIAYDLPEPSEVNVEIFDLLGKHVRTLVNQRQAAGRYAVSWDGRDDNNLLVSNGVFIYQLRAGKFMQSRKMTLIR
jgi:hypothetical protein